MARAAALEIVTQDFVTVARLRGENAWSVMWRELLPNTTGTLLVSSRSGQDYAPVLVGSLGFLGFGLRPPTRSGTHDQREPRSHRRQPDHRHRPRTALASLVIGLNLWTEDSRASWGAASPTWTDDPSPARM